MTSMLKRVDNAVFDFVKSRRRRQAVHRRASVYDLKNDGVGYATSGGQVDDIKTKLDDYKAADHRRQDHGADQAVERDPTHDRASGPGATSVPAGPDRVSGADLT